MKGKRGEDEGKKTGDNGKGQEAAPPVEMAYYPGCSLHGSAREYDESVREVARLLDVRLVELPDWSCCGASSAHMTDHGLAVDLAARNLRIAAREKKDLLVPCAACFQRLKAAQKAAREEPEPDRAGEGLDRLPVLHVSDWLGKPEALARIRGAVKNPLKGLRLVPYYGCLITRPPAVTGASDPEDPKGMDLLIRVLGGALERWSFKTECCGGSLTMARADLTRVLVSRIVRAAVRAGAQGILTMCPMCQANLESRQLDLKRQDPGHPLLPIFFATELVAACTSEGRRPGRWKPHLIDPGEVLSPLGI
ncbi:MAG: heterodisulfide reductase-related iron-sulfur binding cluster [bacterium]